MNYENLSKKELIEIINNLELKGDIKALTSDDPKPIPLKEECLNSIIEESSYFIYIFSTKRGLLYASNQVTSALGYTPSELMRRPFLWYDIIHPDDQINYDRILGNETIKESYTFNYRLRNIQGSWLTLKDRIIKKYRVKDEVIVQSISKDISDIIEVEDKLLESEARYRELFKDAPVALKEEDISELRAYLKTLKDRGIPDLRKFLLESPNVTSECLKKIKTIEVNNEALRLYGAKTKEEMLGCVYNVVPSKNTSSFVDSLVAVSEGERYFEVETVNKKVNGEVIDIWIKCNLPHPKDQKQIARTSIVDVTPIKQAEDKLKFSEASSRAILESSPEIILLLDVDGVVHDCNSTPHTFLGISREELVGTNVFDHFPPELSEVRREAIKKVVEDKKPFIWKDTFMGIVFNNRIYPVVDKYNKVSHVAVYAQDITDLDKKEKELRIQEWAIESSNVAILITDINGVLTYANPKITQLWGYNPDEAVGMKIFEFWKSKNEALQVREAVEDEGSYTGILVAKRRDGSEFDCQLTVSTILDGNGKPVGKMGAFVDVTEKVKAEREAELYLNKLEEANITLKNVLSSIEEDKLTLKQNIALNIEKNIVPVLETIKKSKKYDPQNLNLLEEYIANLTSDFYRKMVTCKYSLTPTELKICQLIKTGYIAKEIADIMTISIMTVQWHKKKIRKKLGITNSSVNLKSFLNEVSL